MPLLLHRFSKDRSSSKSLYRIPSFLLAPCFQHNVSGKPLESGFFSAQRIGVGKDNFAGFKKTQKGSTVKVAVMRRGYLCSEDNATCCTKGIHWAFWTRAVVSTRLFMWCSKILYIFNNKHYSGLVSIKPGIIYFTLERKRTPVLRVVL